MMRHAHLLQTASVIASVIAALFSGALRPVHACTCAGAPLAQVVQGTAVVVAATVERSEAPPGRERLSTLLVKEGIKGARTGERLEVHWRAPDGKSCDFVSLQSGAWLLFLSRLPTGELWTLRCDEYSQPLPRAEQGKVLAQVRKLAAAAPAGLSAEEAVQKAIPAANRALQAAYSRRPEAKGPGNQHKDEWVRAERAQTARLPRGGYRVSWAHHPPAGYEYDAVVEVSSDGSVNVRRADARFSAD